MCPSGPQTRRLERVSGFHHSSPVETDREDPGPMARPTLRWRRNPARQTGVRVFGGRAQVRPSKSRRGSSSSQAGTRRPPHGRQDLSLLLSFLSHHRMALVGQDGICWKQNKISTENPWFVSFKSFPALYVF